MKKPETVGFTLSAAVPIDAVGRVLKAMFDNGCPPRSLDLQAIVGQVNGHAARVVDAVVPQIEKPKRVPSSAFKAEHIREAVLKHCSQFTEDYWLEKDREGVFPHDFYQSLVDAGWLFDDFVNNEMRRVLTSDPDDMTTRELAYNRARVATDHERACTQFGQFLEDAIEVMFAARIEDLQL